jgi:hypothetical protein
MFLVALVVLNVITTTLGDASSRLTVANKTGAYLHVYIEGTAYPYIAPDRSVTHSASPRETFFVEVFYSPGQGKTSDMIDSTFTLPYTPEATYATGDACCCEDPNSSLYCSQDQGVVTNPAQGGSASWQVTEDLFESENN